MSISDWFKAREQGRYTTVGGFSAEKADVPEGVWSKCAACRRIVYQGELQQNLMVCPHCAHHFELSAPERIELLADHGTFDETDCGLTAADPLHFGGSKPYPESVRAARERTGMPEAILTGRASIGGTRVVLGVMDRRFIGASMGSVVGEKVTRAIELAMAERLPLVLVTASGGARMQEGMLSLMQMAKTSAAAERLARAGVPFIALLTDPTYGGVTASFATLADVILAEPGARIGFAGPAVIEQTIRQSLPKGFQTAESMERHGMIDAVVARKDLCDTLERLLRYAVPRKEA
ncbi:MAG TPA: acetyl-CoA carboxylase, carboxyltransferase subunit beta [Coriobacteriia bacterium]